jgi:hypothetical protein
MSYHRHQYEITHALSSLSKLSAFEFFDGVCDGAPGTWVVVTYQWLASINSETANIDSKAWMHDGICWGGAHGGAAVLAAASASAAH